MKKTVTTAFLIFLGLLSYGQTITTDSFYRVMDEIVADGAKEFGMEGVAAAIILPDHLKYDKNSSSHTSYHGVRDNNIAVDPDKGWHFSSTTRMFVSYIIMKLVEDGKMSLSDTIGKYLDTPNIPNLDGDITVQELLSHRSGLDEVWSASSTDLFRDVWDNRDSVWNDNDVLNYLPTKRTNKDFKYTNTNGYILGFVVESVTKKSLQKVFEEFIFEPFKFKNSFISSDKAFDMSTINGVYSGDENRSQWSHNSYMSSRGGNSALVAHPDDVARFLNEFANKDLLTQSSKEIIFTRTPGATRDQGSSDCSDKITYYRGLDFTMVEAITNGDTMNFIGHASNGINNSVVFHWLEGNITVSLVVNDFTKTNESGALFFRLVCHAQKYQERLSSVENFNSSNRVSLYPNPASNVLQVDVINGSIINTIQIFNSEGKIVKADVSNQIDLSALPVGIYYALVELSDGSNVYKRFLKQ